MVSGGGQVRMGGDASDVAADIDTAVSGNGSSKTFAFFFISCFSSS